MKTPIAEQDQKQKTIKDLVKKKYGEIALLDKEDMAGCCGSTCGCSTIDTELMAESYNGISGYTSEADLGLGCGIPTEIAKIKEGNTVIDLGSGAGNDAFVARSITGPSGKVIGIDFTENMINKAKNNAKKLGYENVEFRLGDIEDLPIGADMADVVVSNCVFNLVPDKQKAFRETFRVLKPLGHFSISDIVLEGYLPDGLQNAAELYVGCVSGAIQKKEYLDFIRKAGFIDVSIKREKSILLPDELLLQYLNEEELALFKKENSRIKSITVYGLKPNLDKNSCCEPGCCN